MLANPKHEAFAQALASGAPASRAYRLHVAFRCTSKTADEKGSRLAALGKVRARVLELRALLAQKADEHFVASKLEVLAFLTRVVWTPVGVVDEASELAQDVIHCGHSLADGTSLARRRIKMVSKLHAIDLMARIQGWYDQRGGDKRASDPVAQLLAKVGGWKHPER